MDYVSTRYDEEHIPKTSYPGQLIAYLFNRFNLRRGQKVLELGCGRCEFLNELKENGLEPYGLDREKSSIENEYKLNVKDCDLSTEVFPYDNETFDIVYHKSLIEHIYDPSNLMKETMRVLKPGGKLIILTPNWSTQWKIFYEDYTHSRPYATKALRDLLKVHDMKNVFCDEFLQLPVVWKYPILTYGTKLLKCFINVHSGRWLAKATGLKFFRWSVESMILGYGVK